MKYILFCFVLTCYSFSCGPEFFEDMKINNKSGRNLNFYLALQDNIYYDTNNVKYLNPEIKLNFGLNQDSSIWIRAQVEKGQTLVLHRDYDYYYSFAGDRNGLDLFKSRYDTIFVENFFLNKPLMDFNRWNSREENSKRLYKTYYSLDIVRSDVQ